jgi:hypothetical protein
MLWVVLRLTVLASEPTVLNTLSYGVSLAVLG